MRSPPFSVGEEIFVKIIEIKRKKGEVDLTTAKFDGEYELVKFKKNVARTRIGDITKKSMMLVVS